MKNKSYFSRILFFSPAIMLRIAFLFSFSPAFSQTGQYKLMLTSGDTAFQEVVKKHRVSSFYKDTLSLRRDLEDILFAIRQKGYLAATCDSLILDSLQATASISGGGKYTWTKLSLDSVDEKILNRTGIHSRNFNGQPVNYNRLIRAQEKILTYYENNGYPFASVSLCNVSVHGDSLSGELRIVKNNYILFDSLHIKGDANVSRKYLMNYLGIKKNSKYSEETVRSIRMRLRELAFLEEINPFEINFTEKHADVFLYLKKKRASRFNGVIGFLPNNETTGKLLLTGDLNLFLLNPFRHGEEISFEWKKMETLSQSLNTAFRYPFIFSLPVGTDFRFSLFKKDSTYLTINTVAGLQFIMKGNNYLKIDISDKQSSLLSTANMDVSSNLEYADVHSLLYGIGLKNERLDYRYNPRKGYSINAHAGTGNKKIKKNPDIPETLYEGLDLNSTQVEGLADVSFYQPVYKNNILHLKNKTGYISASTLFENELFRIGGFKTLRGFDEESLTASFYTVFSLEYRYVFELNSAIFLFFDQGYYEKNTNREFSSDHPFGFGAGIDFETKAGILSVSYALGRQQNNPLEMRSAKIHVGIINRF